MKHIQYMCKANAYQILRAILIRWTQGKMNPQKKQTKPKQWAVHYRKNMSICISWSSSEHYTWLWSHTTKQKHNTHPLACHNIANTSSKHYINNLDLHTTTQNHNTQPRIASKNIANTNQSLTIPQTSYLYSLYIFLYLTIYIYIYPPQ